MKHICRIITRLNIGGPARHVAILAKGLRDHGYRTTLVTGEPAPEEGEMDWLFDEADVELIKVPELGREIGVRRDRRAARALREIVERLRPDIVHTHTAKAGYLGRMAAHRARTPTIVHTYHGHTFAGYFGLLKSAFFRQLERRAAKVSTAIVAIGERQRRDIAEIYRIAPRDKVHVIPLGLELDPFLTLPIERDPSTYRSQIDVPAEAKLVTIVGRLAPIKNHAVFLEVATRLAAQMEDAHFLVVGRGPLEDTIRGQAKRLGLDDRMTFAGWVRDMPSVYAASNVVALTSLNEGSPVALIEAQAAGVPVVATDVGGVGDTFLDGESGRICLPEDAEGLTAAIRHYLDRPDEARKAGQAGRGYVSQEFTAEKLIERMAELYRDL
jgi:glycosyltransferase involved in cell wall biosynthesis